MTSNHSLALADQYCNFNTDIDSPHYDALSEIVLYYKLYIESIYSFHMN